MASREKRYEAAAAATDDWDGRTSWNAKTAQRGKEDMVLKWDCEWAALQASVGSRMYAFTELSDGDRKRQSAETFCFPKSTKFVE